MVLVMNFYHQIKAKLSFVKSLHSRSVALLAKGRGLQLIVMLQLFLFAMACNHGHSKVSCNDRAKRALSVFGGSIPLIVDSFEASGNPITSEEASARLGTAVVLDYYLCVANAETDHVDPGIPFAPVWEQAEFEL